MSRTRSLAFAVAMLCLSPCTPSVLAQQTVTISLRRPPPNQLRLADLWRADLNNYTNGPIRVYLHGTVENDRDGLLVEARSTIFSIGPGRTTLRGPELEPITVDKSHPRYRELVARTGTVPSGDYRVCVSVFNAESGEELGTDCFDQAIEQAAPPQLVAPNDGESIVLPNPTFTWLNPGTTRRARYRLRVVELVGRQSPDDAAGSNPPIVSLDNLSATTAMFPLGARKLEPNRRYAWYVEAIDAADPRTVLGRSEVWQFDYVPPSLYPEIDKVPADPNRLIDVEKILLLDDC